MIYSLDRIQAMSEGDEDFVLSIVSLFLEEVPADLVALGAAIEESDYERTYQSAHKMKPNLEIMGMDDARGLAYEIERLGKDQGDFGEIEPRYRKLRTQIDQAVREIRTDFGM